MPARYIALCGAPKSGKTTLAEMIQEERGATIVDDGLPLRRAVHDLYEALGVSAEDPFTQEGKAKIVALPHSDTEVREHHVRNLLGDLGNMLEDKYSQQLLPTLAIAAAKRHWQHDEHTFVFPSCRKSQGLTYRNNGGLVLEIVRRGCKSTNDFDQYDSRYVNYTIVNNGSLNDMRRQALDLIDRYFEGV